MKTFVQILIIFVSSALIGFGFNQLREKPLPIIYKSVELESGSFIEFDQAISLYKNNEALFIDARSPEEFQDGHITGALNIPIKWSRSRKMEKMVRIPKGANVVVYCNNLRCNSAERLAGEMKFSGYKHVAVFTGGWDVWCQRKAPGE
jgi:rhodanese-related sulfurtransferase